MYQLICTSFTKTKNGLVLRNNWIEGVMSDKDLLEIVEKWKLPQDFKYQSKNSISNCLEGKMDIENVVIHVRIIKF